MPARRRPRTTGVYRIVRRSTTSPAQRSTIIVLDPGQGTSRIILEGPAHYHFTAWSPTAGLISFIADIAGDSDIYTIHSNGADLRRLTRSRGNDAHQTWSPDGNWIAFARARQGFKDESVLHPGNPPACGEITVMRADGSDVRVLTDDPFEDGSAGWRSTRPRQ